DPRGHRFHTIAESRIDLHREACLSRVGPEVEAHTLVVRVLLDPGGFDAARIEEEAIRLDLELTKITHDLVQILERVLHVAHQVDVPGGASHRGISEPEHQGIMPAVPQPPAAVRLDTSLCQRARGNTKSPVPDP